MENNEIQEENIFDKNIQNSMLYLKKNPFFNFFIFIHIFSLKKINIITLIV